MKRTMRGAVLGAALLIGCSATVKTATERPPGWWKKKKEVAEKKEEKPRENCLKRKKGLQECLVGQAVEDCKKDRECVAKKIKPKEDYPGKERKVEVEVLQGEEVFSMLVEEGVFIGIVALGTEKIDMTGVEFQFSHKQTDGIDLGEMETVTEAKFRMNYDGSTSGDAWQIQPLEIWDFRVEEADDGAKVSFSTTDPRITVRE